MGNIQAEEARRLVDLCLEAGVNLFDTADIYSNGASEEILGKALGSRRTSILVATKAFSRMGPGPNDVGLTRHHLMEACHASLRRLETDYIDLYQVHNFDSLAPMEETLRALDDLVHQGKVRYIGCSNYSGWQLMKALGISDRLNLVRYVSQQIYYSLVAREAEHELVPLGLDQQIGILVWSPLAFGFLSGKFRRGQPEPGDTRRARLGQPGAMDLDRGYAVVELLHEIAQARQASPAQVAINYLRHKPGVTSIIIGARNEAQLCDNLAAAGWTMTDEEMKRLDKLTAVPLPYPHWHQLQFAAERNPALAARARG
jgi:aryl-alcohol dehydrogenase-like predicted oxidoreductase